MHENTTLRQRIPITSREQWLELRRHDVTASTVGALFGCHPYQTIAGLHCEKTGLDLDGPDPESAVIRRGHALEHVVAAEVAKLRPGWAITKNTDYLRDRDARIGATPDFWITDEKGRRGVLQTKTIGSYKFKKEWGGAAAGSAQQPVEDGRGRPYVPPASSLENPTPPFWIVLQNATEVMLSDCDFGAVGALVIGDWTFDCHVIEVPRHRPAEVRIRDAVAKFWASVDAGEVPQLDYERDGDLVALMYPAEVPGKVIDLTQDNRIVALLEERESCAQVIRYAEKQKEELDTELKAKLGDAEAAVVPGWTLTNKTTNRRQTVQPACSYRVVRATREKSA